MAGFDVELTAKPRGWDLVDCDAMFAAVKELTRRRQFGTRFHGSIQFFWRDGELVWLLDVHDDEQPKRPAGAACGDRLLFAGNVLQKLDAEKFAAIVKPAEGRR